MPRKHKQKGGVHLPSEYFGKNSGRYSDVAQALQNSAYGKQHAVSHGMNIGNNMVGPDLGANNNSGLQTGGGLFTKIVNPATGRKVSIYGKKGKEILKNYINQAGGANLPSEYFGKNSGRYSNVAQALQNSAYGKQHAVSHGINIGNNMVGPDLGANNNSGLQTGGQWGIVEENFSNFSQKGGWGEQIWE